MKLTLEDRIRQRAYFLWLDSAGVGEDIHFWLVAESQVLAEVAMESTTASRLAEATAEPNPESAERQLARRVNALVLLESDSDSEQAAFGLVGA